MILFFFGIILGVITGLLPGLHSNTVISILSSFEIDQFYLLIIAIVPAQMIVSFVPSIFFGIPEQGTVISVLPGHRMTLQGKGLLALKTVILSILLATLISLAVFPLSLEFYPFVYEMIRPFMKYVVLMLSIALLVRSKNPLLSTLVFVAAGLIGYVSLTSRLEDPFLPLFSGLFAIPALLTYARQKLPEQKDYNLKSFDLRYVIAGVIGGGIAGLLPGISSPGEGAGFLTMGIAVQSPG